MVSSTDVSHTSGGATQLGFTMVELVAVIIVISVLSVTAYPRMQAAFAVRTEGWHDGVVSALRLAQKSAVARRRLTCVTLSSTSVQVQSASTSGATSCSTALRGPDGSANFATQADSSVTLTVSPSGVLYFQPDGRVSTDGAGTTFTDRTIAISTTSTITVYGETGHVE